MSQNQKLRGTSGQVPELTRLKVLWRDALDEAARDFWRGQFEGTARQADIRGMLKREHGIDLKRDQQLTEFRAWLEEQDARDEEAARQGEDERLLAEAHPDWDQERLRSEVIAASMRRALATGDFKGLGLKAVRAGQNEKVIHLDTEKFKEGLRSKLESAMEALAQHIKGNPKAQAAFTEFKSAVAESTK
jgi:glycine/D-amino acid oxidase-like deaminating enzyme